MTGSITDFRYTQSFVSEWLSQGTRGRRFIVAAAKDQHGNLKHLLWNRRHSRRVPCWCDLAEYCKSVRLLRKTARDIEAGRI